MARVCGGVPHRGLLASALASTADGDADAAIRIPETPTTPTRRWHRGHRQHRPDTDRHRRPPTLPTTPALPTPRACATSTTSTTAVRRRSRDRGWRSRLDRRRSRRSWPWPSQVGRCHASPPPSGPSRGTVWCSARSARPEPPSGHGRARDNRRARVTSTSHRLAVPAAVRQNRRRRLPSTRTTSPVRPAGYGATDICSPGCTVDGVDAGDCRTPSGMRRRAGGGRRTTIRQVTSMSPLGQFPISGGPAMDLADQNDRVLASRPALSEPAILRVGSLRGSRRCDSSGTLVASASS